ncbi:Regulatory protein BlaR1 [Symmachiella dynata]|uniref:Regulatory protein BlaR1 n=2 Tax=Symmachiella dynata TaxID=2527995 RepID=A0A517ZHR1_9PLAN|nr:M56 family metallopeptidase [Symmachiella dynata]QDU41992.1 Regulatory protein BlaR1 [Symmachiella dynata]
MHYILQIGLSNAVLVALMAFLIFCVHRYVKNPHLLAILWTIVLAKLIMPPLVSLPVSLPLNQGEFTVLSSQTISPTRSPVATNRLGDTRTDDRIKAVIAQPNVSESLADISHSAIPSPPIYGEEAAPQPRGEIAQTWGNRVGAAELVLIWLAGGGVWLVIVISRAMRFDRLVRQAPAAATDITRTVEHLVSRLGIKARLSVRVIDAAISPMVWAFGLQTVIVLPRRLMEQLSGEQREMLLAHELAHVRRGDHRLRWLEIVVLAIYWWYPVAWWTRKQLHRMQEECCDAHVLELFPKRAHAYSEVLLTTAEAVFQQRAAPLWASEFSKKPHLKQRIEAMLKPSNSLRFSRSIHIAARSCAIALLGISMHWSAADAHSPEDSDAISAIGDKDQDQSNVGSFDDTHANDVKTLVNTPVEMTVEALRKVWEKRVAKTQAYRVVWKTERTEQRARAMQNAAMYLRVFGNDAKSINKIDSQLANIDKTQETIKYDDETTMSFRGPAMRLETSGARVVWKDNKLRPIAFHKLEVTDGNVSMSYRPFGSRDQHAYGNIYYADVLYDSSNKETFPIRACFRPLTEETTSREFPLSVLQPATEEDITILGEKNPKAVVFKQKYDFYDTGRRTLMSFDPDKEYNLTRYASMHDKFTVAYTLDIQYEYKHEYDLWIPRQWRFDFYDARGKTVQSSRDSTVLSSEHNPTIPDEQYSIDYPVGTIVYDHRNEGRDFKGNNSKTVYVEGPGGEKKLITDIGAYEEILASDVISPSPEPADSND